MKDQTTKRHTVVIRRTPPGCSRDEIVSAFEQYGPLEGEGLRFPKSSGATKDPRIFVDFKRPESAQKAMEALDEKPCSVLGNIRLSLQYDAPTLRRLVSLGLAAAPVAPPVPTRLAAGPRHTAAYLAKISTEKSRKRSKVETNASESLSSITGGLAVDALSTSTPLSGAAVGVSIRPSIRLPTKLLAERQPELSTPQHPTPSTASAASEILSPDEPREDEGAAGTAKTKADEPRHKQKLPRGSLASFVDIGTIQMNAEKTKPLPNDHTSIEAILEVTSRASEKAADTEVTTIRAEADCHPGVYVVIPRAVLVRYLYGGRLTPRSEHRACVLSAALPSGLDF